jgi:hypothetical protein
MLVVLLCACQQTFQTLGCAIADRAVESIKSKDVVLTSGLSI